MFVENRGFKEKLKSGKKIFQYFLSFYLVSVGVASAQIHWVFPTITHSVNSRSSCFADRGLQIAYNRPIRLTQDWFQMLLSGNYRKIYTATFHVRKDRDETRSMCLVRTTNIGEGRLGHGSRHFELTLSECAVKLPNGKDLHISKDKDTPFCSIEERDVSPQDLR